jgi:hypothetical protein
MPMTDEATHRYSTARGYLEAAKMIFLSEHHEGHRVVLAALPLHMLVSFALELYFKAWLLKFGVPSDDVQKFGHRLADLYTAAKTAGLPDVASLDDVVKLFAGPRGDFTLRYIGEKDNVRVAAWTVVFPILDQLDVVVDRFVGVRADISRVAE